MLHQQLVFTNSFEIILPTTITTDVFDNTAQITGPFRIPLDEGQEFTAGRMNVIIDRIGGFLQGEIQVLLNGIRIQSGSWASGRTEAVVFDFPIPLFVKTDGSTNLLTVQVSSNPFDGFNQWIIRSGITYNINTEEPPTELPDVDEPVIDDSQPGGPDERELGFFENLLFGDAIRTARTVAIIAIGIGGVVLLSQVIKLVRVVKPVSRAAV